MAKLPNFLFEIKRNFKQKNQTQFIDCRTDNRRYFSVLVISLMFGFTSNVQATENDSDGDGLSDSYEVKIGTESYLSDTDGDGISDGEEVGENLEMPLDTDKDGVINALDYDDDNDGLPTYLESKKDTDNDKILGYLDTDSDNDGVLDGEEAGYLNQDKNHDGIDDAFDLARKGSVDENGDGIDDNVKLPNYDKVGKPDYLDASYQHRTIKKVVDSKKIILVKEKPNTKSVEALDPQKNEKKPNVVAKQIVKETEVKKKIVPKKVTQVAKVEKDVKAKQDPMIINRHTDSDNDGLSNDLEKILGTNPLNRDSDGDRISDAIEIGMDINVPQDSDRDGIIDALDNDDDNDGILTKLEDLNGDGTAINEDTDNDGVPNYLDANDDGDNLLTRDEGSVLDSDGDTILDYLDKNDGIKDKSNASNTKLVKENTEITKEPEVVVLFDGDAAALTAEAIDEETENGNETVQDNLLGSLQDLNLDKEKLENVESDQIIEQAKLNIESSSSAKKSTNAWDLF